MYSYFDTHCDTLLKLYLDGKTLFDKELHINYETLSMYENTVQCFALFNEGQLKIGDFFDAAAFLKRECESSGKMALCTDTYEIDQALSRGKIAAILTIEALGNTPDFKARHISDLKKCGYMMAGLVWNYDNSLCGGACGENSGLTALGEHTLRNMESVGMIADVSHMSEESFENTADVFCKPIVASHSNSAFVCPHVRNLSDKNIVRIIDSGGAVGVNVYPPFVGWEGGIDDVVCHIDRIISLGGAKNICIGADLDGIDSAVCGIKSGADITKLFDALICHNYPKSLINDISFNNIYNIFKKYEILN